MAGAVTCAGDVRETRLPVNALTSGSSVRFAPPLEVSEAPRKHNTLFSGAKLQRLEGQIAAAKRMAFAALV